MKFCFLHLFLCVVWVASTSASERPKLHLPAYPSFEVFQEMKTELWTPVFVRGEKGLRLVCLVETGSMGKYLELSAYREDENGEFRRFLFLERIDGDFLVDRAEKKYMQITKFDKELKKYKPFLSLYPQSWTGKAKGSVREK